MRGENKARLLKEINGIKPPVKHQMGNAFIKNEGNDVIRNL